MYRLHVVDRPEIFAKDVYVYETRANNEIALMVPFIEGGYTYVTFAEGTAFPDHQVPTYRISYEWEQELVKALSPAVPKVEKFLYDTVSYERSIIDRLLK